MSDFYLTLPSNSSMNYYKANTLANFTTRLPNTIDLTGDWEVGLVEIQYPHNWYNVPAEESCRTFRVRCQSADNENGPQAAYDFMIPAGYYHRVQTMLNQIEEKANHVLKSTNSTINLNYDKISRKVSMERSLCRLTLPPHIRKMLGMTMVSSFANNQSKADSVVDMDPVDSLYVYCDVVEPRVVGDKQVPLLRIVPVEGDHGQLMTRIYENVHYVRLQQKSFQTIEIDIRDRTGNMVPFEQGTLNVTLHFRQRKRLSTLWTWKAEACLCILEHPIREAMVSAVSWKTFSVRQLLFSNMRDGRHWKQGSLW